jgi:hypothetical protein
MVSGICGWERYEKNLSRTDREIYQLIIVLFAEKA